MTDRYGELRHIMLQNSWYSGLPKRLQDGLLAGKRRRLESGTPVFTQGAPVEGMFAIVEGQVTVSGVGFQGNSTLYGYHRPSDWAGFLATIDGKPHAATATAITPATVHLVSRDRVLALFGSDAASLMLFLQPEFAIARSNYDYFNNIYRMTPLARVARRLIELSRWAYSPATGPHHPLIGLKQEDLASTTLLARQTVNGILRQLTDRGLIAVSRQRIDLLDPEELHRVARSD